MKKLLLSPAIAFPFFLVSCSQPGDPVGSTDQLPLPSQSVTEFSAQTSYSSEKAQQRQKRQKRQYDTNTSAS